MRKASGNIFEQHLERTSANYTALSPLGFIERTATVFPERTAVVHGELQRDWGQTYERVHRLASALRARGVERGEAVAVMLANTPEMLEAHFAVAMVGAVLNALNVHQEARTIAFILQDSESRVLITDTEFSETVEKALDTLPLRPLVIDVDDPQSAGGERLGKLDYAALLAEGDPAFAWESPRDEWDAIAVNYTAGTTGNPKAVVYHHRGARLQAVSHVLAWGMPQHPVYLWTLPMFHCNGWGFPWTITAMAGTHVCLRQRRAEAVFEAIRRHQVSHFCASPALLSRLLAAPAELKRGFDHPIKVMTAAAAPSAAVISGTEAMGIELTHVYDLTEAYGPATVCAWHPEWDKQPLEQRARIKARQGVRYPMLDGLMVADPRTLDPVAKDGRTIGELCIRGNTIMKGYLKSEQVTEEAFAGGWFHTGDLAVWHPDGYVEIKDRGKDIITSDSGEKISTLEIESVLGQHPAVMEAAVVARKGEQGEEVPCAFVSLKPDAEDISAEAIIEFCRQNMAHFKVPERVVFCELPKTPTGQVQKFKLRAYAWRL